MKLCKFALGVVVLAISTSSLAGMVTVSSNLEFLAINGQKASKSLLKEKKIIQCGSRTNTTSRSTFR